MAHRREILHFETINALHEATGFVGRTDLPGAHVFTLEETAPSTRASMPPYTLGFYAVMLFMAPRSGEVAEALLDMNSERHRLTDVLAFQGPGHVTAWARGAEQGPHGFAAFFRAEFLAPRPAPVEAEFPFFRPHEVNVLNVLTAGAAEQASVRGHFERLHAAFQEPHPYRAEVVRTLLLALLFDARRIYDRHRSAGPDSPAAGLVARFQLLVGQHFLTKKTVRAYADLLHVMPNHLSAAVSQTLGRPARAVIADRVVVEAKNHLRHTDLTAAEIAFRLGFSEPTHFGRFFKRTTGMPPLAYRRHALEALP